MVFPFVFELPDRCIGISERPVLTTEDTLYSDLLHNVGLGLRKLSWPVAEIEVLMSENGRFEMIVVDTYAGIRSTVRFTRKSVPPSTKYSCVSRRFGMLSFLDESTFENYIGHTISSYCRTSKRMKSRTEGIIRVFHYAIMVTRTSGISTQAVNHAVNSETKNPYSVFFAKDCPLAQEDEEFTPPNVQYDINVPCIGDSNGVRLFSNWPDHFKEDADFNLLVFFLRFLMQNDYRPSFISY